MAQDTDKLFKKIRALLALADDNANEHEAALAAEKAARLIQKYNLDIDAVRDWTAVPEISHVYVYLDDYLPPSYGKRGGKLRRRRQGRRHQRYWQTWPPKASYAYGQTEWFVYLAGAVARVCGCEAPYFSTGNVTFVGDSERINQAAFLLGNIFGRLLIMADQAVKDYATNYKEATGTSPWQLGGVLHPNRYRRGWLEGAAMEVGSRLNRQAFDAEMTEWKKRQEKKNPARENAIVSLRKAIEDYKSEKFGWITRELAPDEGDGSSRGYAAGRDAGETFTIQQGITEGGAISALPKE